MKMASPQVEIASFDSTPKWVSRVAKNNLGSLDCNKIFRNAFGDKDDSSLSALVSPRHSKIIDRWAARQAQEVVKNLEKNNENVVVKRFDNFPSRSSSFNSRREREVSISPPRSDGSSESETTFNIGASSLVQMWEKRLNNQSNCTKQNAPSYVRTNSSLSSNEINACYVEEHSRVSEKGESFDDAFSSGESDKPRLSIDETCSSKVHCKLDASQSEKIKVADIIKRLSITSDENDHELSNSVTSSPCVSTPKQLAEHKGFVQITSFPRIRGRQAFNDLIMHFECDRHGELNNLAERGAVSKFTQRGRIQSLLRLRLLQRGVAAFDPSRLKSTTPEGNKQQQGSVIMQLREKFNTKNEQRASSLAEVIVPKSPCREIVNNTYLAEVTVPKNPCREIVNNTIQLDNYHTTNQLNKENACCKIVTNINTKKHKQNVVSQISADVKEEARSSSGFEAHNHHDPNETSTISSSKDDSNANETAEKVEAKDQQLYDTIETSYYDEMLEEKECSDYNYDETIESYDWASPISRPRSYWEEIRQEWYKEMLDFGSHNDERRKLLERKTVSTVLSSDFREKMDKLMKSHVGTQTHLINNQCDEEDEEESTKQLMSFYHNRLRDTREKEVRRNEEEVDEEKAEEHEHESINSGSDHELGDCQSSSSIDTPSSATWSYRDTDGGDDSDRVAFVSSPLPSQSQSCYEDSRQYSPSTDQRSIEMDFIYGMRGQMEQLFQEMSELRKTIKNCTDIQMQMQLQQSQNQEVHKFSVKEKKLNKTSKKGMCCLCNENKVNSVLYRCGHMCACFKCANELQWKSGKCPKCQIAIIDVVEVHTNT